ncbi:hypothetical protein D3C80_1301700 [compost metagenome]
METKVDRILTLLKEKQDKANEILKLLKDEDEKEQTEILKSVTKQIGSEEWLAAVKDLIMRVENVR